jgi:hypothetical protein
MKRAPPPVSCASRRGTSGIDVAMIARHGEGDCCWRGLERTCILSWRLGCMWLAWRLTASAWGWMDPSLIADCTTTSITIRNLVSTKRTPSFAIFPEILPEIQSHGGEQHAIASAIATLLVTRPRTQPRPQPNWARPPHSHDSLIDSGTLMPTLRIALREHLPHYDAKCQPGPMLSYPWHRFGGVVQ